MTTPLTEQIRDYFADIESQQGAIDIDALMDRDRSQLATIEEARTPPPVTRDRWRVGLAAAAAVVALIVGLVVVRSVDDRGPVDDVVPKIDDTMPVTTDDPPTSVFTTEALEPTPSTVESHVPSTSTAIDLEEFFSDHGLRRLPGTTYSAAGQYWWTGSRDTGAWMHNAQTQLYFTVRDDCFAEAPGSSPSAVTVAGVDGRYLEPYLGGAPWLDSRHGEATAGAYSLSIGDRTLCVYIWWDAATTPSKRQALRDIVESIQARPYGEAGVQVVFTLPEGWDTG